MPTIREKIAGAFGSTTEQRIETERAAIAAIDGDLVDLRNKQAANLLDQDARASVDGADKITVAERLLVVHRSRLKALMALLRREA